MRIKYLRVEHPEGAEGTAYDVVVDGEVAGQVFQWFEEGSQRPVGRYGRAPRPKAHWAHSKDRGMAYDSRAEATGWLLREKR